jgi:arginyl-tRNA synthetase
MHIEPVLQQSVSQALEELFGIQIPAASVSLQPTRKDFEGSHTFVTFPYAKQTRKSPDETARLVGEYLQSRTGIVARFNVVKGFLNLALTDRVWLDVFRSLEADPQYGEFPDNGRAVMVEYSSPNTNKPLHLGHLRNNFLGYSVAEILKANGYKVFRTNVVNDRGIHICKSMLAYQKFGQGETPQSAGIKGDHLIGDYYVKFEKALVEETKPLLEAVYANDLSLVPENKRKAVNELLERFQKLHSEGEEKKVDDIKGEIKEIIRNGSPLMLEAQQMLRKWEQGDPGTVALWKKMNGWVYEGFEQTYKRMGVWFDKYYYESNTYLLGKDIIEEGLQKGVFYRRPDGSVWADLTGDGLDEKLVLRSDGTSVYITQDLGTADLKYGDYGMEKSLYVVATEQDYHFQVLFLILKKLGRTYAEGLYHLSYGMVDLPTGRMKSREGTVVDADDLMDEMVQTARERTQELGKIEEYSPEHAHSLYEMLGVGALKYFLLKVDPKKRMVFNPEESIDFQGHTASYIQYSHARTSAILRKAKSDNVSSDWSELKEIHATEKDLIALMATYPDRVKDAGADYSPAVLAQFAYELARSYSRFFTDVSIFNADTEVEKRFRVALTAQTARLIRKSMNLLGIGVPERM